MSYRRTRRRALHGVQSRAAGSPVLQLAGVQSRVPGRPVSMGGPPDWYRAMQGPPDWYRAMQGTSLGDDTIGGMTDEQWRKEMLAEQRAVRQWQERWVKADEMQRWIQIAVTASIPLFGAIWKVLGIGRRSSSTTPG